MKHKVALFGAACAAMAMGSAAGIALLQDNGDVALAFGIKQIASARGPEDALPADLASNLEAGGWSVMPTSSRLLRADGPGKYYTFTGGPPGRTDDLCFLAREQVVVAGAARTRTRMGCSAKDVLESDGALGLLGDEADGSWTYVGLVPDGVDRIEAGGRSVPVVGNVARLGLGRVPGSLKATLRGAGVSRAINVVVPEPRG